MDELEIIDNNCDNLLELFRKNLIEDKDIISHYEQNPPKDLESYNMLFNDLEGNILFNKTLLSETDDIIKKLNEIKELANTRIQIDTRIGSIVNKHMGKIVLPSLQRVSEDSTRKNVDISRLPEEQQKFAENLLELQGHREKSGGKSKRKKLSKNKYSRKR